MPNHVEIRPLETPRLLLFPLTLEDAADAQRLFPHWEIVRYLASYVPWPYPADGALAYYRDAALPAMAAGNEWHWSIRLKSAPDTFIGAIALIAHADTNRGFWLGLPWQGQGLATEASEAVTAFWFDDIGASVLRTSKAIANSASSRISRKNGMTLIRTEDRDYVSGRLPSEIWEITAEQWRRR
jgi:RimJ/RimL family protein N-acetyltransferase